MKLLVWLVFFLLLATAGILLVRWLQGRGGGRRLAEWMRRLAGGVPKPQQPPKPGTSAQAASGGVREAEAEAEVPVLMEPVELPAEAGRQTNRQPELFGDEDAEPAMVPLHRPTGDRLRASAVEATDDATGEVEKEAESATQEAWLQLYVMAPMRGSFGGPELLQALVGCGLSFGRHGIFHFCEEEGGRVLFSSANAVKPGRFELAGLEELTTPGLLLFMALHEHQAPLPVFERMLEAAERLAATLGGLLEDETHSAMTPQTTEHYREKIREYVLKYPR